MLKTWKNIYVPTKKMVKDHKRFLAKKYIGTSGPVTIIKERSIDTFESLDQLASLSYEEYLQSKYWFYKRSKILKRDSFRCSFCKSKKNLNVHHKIYRKRGAERDTDLITLCNVCHNLAHSKSGNKVKKFIQRTKTKNKCKRKLYRTLKHLLTNI